MEKLVDVGRQLSHEMAARQQSAFNEFADAPEEMHSPRGSTGASLPPVRRLASNLHDTRRLARAQILESSTVLFHTESWFETLTTPSEYLPPLAWFIVLAFVVLVTYLSILYPDHLGLDDRMHQTMISFISLLIVFRTGEAYARWWEGRTLWGAIVNSTRNLASNAVTFMHDSLHYQRVVICTIGFAYATKQALRGAKFSKPEMVGLFDEEELDLMNQVEHIPMLMVDEIRRWMKAELIDQGPHGSRVASSYNWDLILANDLKALVDALGGCERIAKTPMPFGYLSQLRIFMIIWIVSWPFALTPDYGWATIAVVGFVALIMMKVEEMAVHIEHPFGTEANDLPVDAICVTIERNLLEILRRAEHTRSHGDAPYGVHGDDALVRLVPPRELSTMNLNSGSARGGRAPPPPPPSVQVPEHDLDHTHRSVFSLPASLRTPMRTFSAGRRSTLRWG